jgi:hypothetical protein
MTRTPIPTTETEAPETGAPNISATMTPIKKNDNYQDGTGTLSDHETLMGGKKSLVQLKTWDVCNLP